jgi:TatD DNase family protein
MSKKKKSPGIRSALELPAFEGTLWDMHTHLDMITQHLEGLRDEYEVEIVPVAQIVRASVSAGITGLLHCACELDAALSIGEVLDEVQQVQGVECAGAIAIHPNEAVLHEAGKGGCPEVIAVAPDGLKPPELRAHHRRYSITEAVEELYNTIIKDSRIKVIGETGLDFFRTAPDGIGAQKKSFREHIALAKELNLPVQIHDREAHREVLDILKDTTPPIALFHSFSGDTELAKICVEKGYYMSFSGVITFNATQSLRDAFKYVLDTAPELLLIETDAPFLTPTPHRGATNSPAMISHTLTYLANHFQLDLAALCAQIATNQKQLL